MEQTFLVGVAIGCLIGGLMGAIIGSYGEARGWFAPSAAERDAARRRRLKAFWRAVFAAKDN
jgi:hypothetical protein